MSDSTQRPETPAAIADFVAGMKEQGFVVALSEPMRAVIVTHRMEARGRVFKIQRAVPYLDIEHGAWDVAGEVATDLHERMALAVGAKGDA